MAIAAGILALTAVAVPAQALAATSGASTISSPSRASCPDFDFIGVRGAGQADEASGQFRGFGPEVEKMITVMQYYVGHVIGDTSDSKAISYPAAPVKVLIPSAATIKLFLKHPAAALVYWYNHNVKEFLSSIAEGVSETESYVKAEAKSCPSTRLVLVGYSQGAMVVHEAELKLHLNNQSSIPLTGTILLADGYRVPNTKAVRSYGTSKASGQGIATSLHHGVGDVSDPHFTFNICDANDVVCNFGANLFLHIPSAISVHTSYAKCNAKNQCTYKGVLTTAADRMAYDITHQGTGYLA
jgi:Cutinase